MVGNMTFEEFAKVWPEGAEVLTAVKNLAAQLEKEQAENAALMEINLRQARVIADLLAKAAGG